MKKKLFYSSLVFVFLMLAIILSGCTETPSYPSEVTLELVSKQNMDLFQVEATKPVFDGERAHEHAQYPCLQKSEFLT